jgi:GAF domain-containing protein
MNRETKLARTFVELADTLVADFDVVELLTLLTDRCVDILGVDAAGLMLQGADGDLKVLASSSDAMRMLELFELQAKEGPCLDAFLTGEAVSGADLSLMAGRWPAFAPRALTAGFHSVQALPMRLRGSVIGALNLFHTLPGDMPERDVEVAQAFADVATIAILQQRAAMEAMVVNDQLNIALNSRIMIEQAKGMVAERLGTDMPTSFATMRTYARQKNRRLVDVAEDIISGVLLPSTLR